MKNSQDIHAKIRDYISSQLNAKGDNRIFNDFDPLVTSGRLDSLDVVKMVVFLEDEFSLDFSKIGFDQNIVDSVSAIIKLIETS